MAKVTKSRLALYEGIIALAWLDHELHPNEKEGLHTLINSNVHFDEEQKAMLHKEVDKRPDIKKIWSRITSKEDKAHLLDISHMIFLKDGEYCDNEKEFYDTYLAKHMASLDTEAIANEVRELYSDLRAKHAADVEEAKEYAKKYSLVTRIGNLFKKEDQQL